MKLYRASLAHTPRNPFLHIDALETFVDGGLVVDKDRILEVGEFSSVQAKYPTAKVIDCTGSFIMPGLVDCHVHFPQVSVIGTMGVQLLEWLVTRTLPEEEETIDEQRSLALFRCLQESLTNIAKHAAASLVRVTFAIDDTQLVLSVIDNGRGFEAHALSAPDSFGIRGLDARVTQLGGSFKIQHQAPQGTRVLVAIPKQMPARRETHD